MAVVTTRRLVGGALLAVLSGGLLVVSYAPFGWWPLVFVGLVPMVALGLTIVIISAILVRREGDGPWRHDLDPPTGPPPWGRSHRKRATLRDRCDSLA